MNTATKHSLLGLARLAAQIAAFVVTILYSFHAVKSLGLPNWAFMGSILLLGVFFCGWACPFGTAQEWLRGVGKSMTGMTIRIPQKINRYLLFSRYLLFPLIAVAGIAALDTRRTFMTSLAGGTAGAAALAILGAILVLSLFMERPFCKYLCGFGAITGLVSMLRVFGVKRDSGKCADCRRCNDACGMDVDVAKAHTVRDPHCINCGKCLAACPVPGALKPGFALPCLADVKALRGKYAPDGAQPGAVGRDEKDGKQAA